MNSYNPPMNQPYNQTYPIQPQATPALLPNNQIAPNYGAPQPGMPFQPVPSYPIAVNNVIPGSRVPLLVNNNSNYSLQALECFEDLNEASGAIVTKFFEGLIFKDTKYNVSIRFRNGGVDRHLFIAKKTQGNIFEKDAFKVQVKYIPRDTNYTDFIKDKKFDKRFIDVSTVKNLIQGCSKPEVQVFNIENDTCLGSIRQPNACCCSDPDFQIKNSSNFIKYRVVTNGCQCAYCCCDGCCCLLSPVSYKILDSTNTQIVGEILKSELSNTDKALLNYSISFPIDATADEKILIISTAIAIDNFIYKSIG